MREKRVINLKSSYLLKRFNVYFLIFSIIPLLALFYLFTQYESQTTINVSKPELSWLTAFIALASLVGFFAVRGAIKKIVFLSENLRRALFKDMDRSVILDLAKEEGEVAELAKTFGDILGRLEENIKELEETKKTLYGVLSKVGRALSSIENFDALIHLILETTVNALGAESGAIFSLNEEGRFDLKTFIGEGITPEEVKTSLNSFVDLTIKERKTVFIPSLEKEKSKPTFTSAPLVCMPLNFREKTWGVICLCGRKRGENFTEEELRILSNLSYQIAISFENAKLSKDIERTYFETMSALALAVEARDPYSRGHSERVGEYAAKVGEVLGIPQKDIQTLRDASRLHDIGKIGVMDNILKKEGALSPEEKEIMNKHPLVGESIVKPLKTFQPLLEPIIHHHELLDGSGYPHGLKGDQIPLITRILSVVDIFDALTTNRPYRKGLSKEQVKEELEKLVGEGKIDREVVGALFKLIDEGKI
jgi:HD-GYP domain-containing protein (c-di-GMP phosphodiesterase class II)